MFNLFNHLAVEEKIVSDTAYAHLVEEYEATCESIKEKDEQIKRLQIQLANYRQWTSETFDLLESVRDVLNEYADVDHNGVNYTPNEAMTAIQEIDKHFEKPWGKS